ncbi:hypothetical protein AMTRI_Chr03g45510 [Amborella trichopoda]|uniref:RRM domain-containing protein n=1 Tax=Amborella trichopoda TaxID=13333 RepID=W1NZZ1_AMBTC|nr:heterogeneous nuclear ribonucleoprotein H2 [Amborella trichopoda]ERN00886.1 hypothetical protein AMTR_s00103p00136100 [Amborella trichopoda]|eukprot:XP_006838317.1 heterogeneous nuclear ribonucleoprotein H2 [Amborella trichopoda]
MYSRGKFMEGGEGHEMGSKRQRIIDTNPYYSSAGTSLMYTNPYPPAYIGQPRPFPVIRLRGLPFNCSETDVEEFLHGFNIIDILFVHKKGRFSGEAFVVLGLPVQVDWALQRNRLNMGRRYIEVFRSKRQEYYNAVANEVADSKNGPPSPPHRSAPRARSYDEGKDLVEHTGVLKLRGLPFSATKEDIIEFFKEFDISEDNITLMINSEGRATGEAFVEFASPEDSKAAMVKDRMTLGSRYIELFASTPEEAEEAASRNR